MNRRDLVKSFSALGLLAVKRPSRKPCSHEIGCVRTPETATVKVAIGWAGAYTDEKICADIQPVHHSPVKTLHGKRLCPDCGAWVADRGIERHLREGEKIGRRVQIEER